jgi:hypothetical protein
MRWRLRWYAPAWVRISLIVLVVILSGWRETQPAAAPTIDKLDAPAHPASHHTVWEGKYICAQGVTGLHLELDTASNGVTTGIFEFYGVPENPNSVPRGSYRMRGKLTMVEAGSFALALEPDEWIVQPPGYVMVGLKAASDRERRSMTGRITNPSCGGMKVARVT